MTVRINISTRNKVNARKGPNKLCKCESDLQMTRRYFLIVLIWTLDLLPT